MSSTLISRSVTIATLIGKAEPFFLLKIFAYRNKALLPTLTIETPYLCNGLSNISARVGIKIFSASPSTIITPLAKNRFAFVASKNLSRNSNTRVEVGSQILSNFPTDSYTFVIALIDSLSSTGISTAKKFFVYNPDIVVVDTFETSTTPVLSSTFGSMSEDELDDLFEKSRYLATKTEIDKYERLSNVEGKREFTFEFWKVKEETFGTAQGNNEFYRTYLQRIDLCNQRYSTMGKQGWKTDRGRVYLLYGEPTEIERYPNQLETRPYEIWQYTEIEGGVNFVFADLTGFSDYTLVHSTKRGELRDDNWQRRIVVR